jgi:hypothetical protein
VPRLPATRNEPAGQLADGATGTKVTDLLDVVINLLTFFVNVRYLYTLFLSLDGCFKLKLKNRGFADYALSSGWMYFVNKDRYNTYCDSRRNDLPEVRYRLSAFIAS